MKKIIIHIFLAFIFISGFLIIIGFFDPIINNWVFEKLDRNPGNRSILIFKGIGFGFIILSILLFVINKKQELIKRFYRLKIFPTLAVIDNKTEGLFSKFLDYSKSNLNCNKKSFNKFDLLFIFLAIIVSLLIVTERLQGNYPNVILGSDAANISSMAVALEKPELFQNDFYLKDQSNFKLYLQLHVFIIRYLGKLLNNYTLPFVIILGPTVFLTLIGNYWLGRMIMNNRFWALLFVLFNSIPIYLLFENWGLAEDAVPRTLMQAVFPFLLGLLWLWRNEPKKWPIIAFFTGLLTYIHAVGTPTIMVSVILCFFWLMPKSWSLRKKITSIVFLSLIMLITGSIFIGNYLTIKQQVEPFDYETTIRLYRNFFPPNILDVSTSAKLLIKFFWNTWLLPLGFLGLINLWILKNDSRELSKIMMTWIFGIFIVTICIPFFERIIESYLRILPIETELIRGSRFFIPLLGLISLASLSKLSMMSKFTSLRILFLILGIVFIGRFYSFSSTNLLKIEKTRACFQKGEIICDEKSDLQNLLTAIDELTPTTTSIFFSNNSQDTFPLAVRYISHRSLVYSWKDRGLGFSHPNKMLEWHNIFSVIDEYNTTTDWLIKEPENFINFIQGLDAEYLVLNKNNLDFEVKFGDPIYENQSYILIKVNN